MCVSAAASIDVKRVPLGLYVHLPWCVRKCPYCDFNSHEARTDIPENGYVDALLADLEWSQDQLGKRRFATVYFGGGTPSLFSGAAIGRLLDELRAGDRLDSRVEITLEANPGSVDESRFESYRDAGINRLSLGVQSFNDEHLRALGRVHDSAASVRAVDLANRCFDNWNLDLMYGLPGQSAATAGEDVSAALDSGATHLSCYQLTLEPNTVFHKYPPALPPADEQANIEDTVLTLLDAAGFEHYEVSAHARPGFHCRHNLNYWEFGDYLGIGAGAHSKLTSVRNIERTARVRMPQSYLRKAGSGAVVGEHRALNRDDRTFEFMLNALRLRGGYSPSLMTCRTGIHPETVAPALVRAAERGLLEVGARCVRPTDLGWRHLNRVLQDFLPDVTD